MEYLRLTRIYIDTIFYPLEYHIDYIINISFIEKMVYKKGTLTRRKRCKSRKVKKTKRVLRQRGGGNTFSFITYCTNNIKPTCDRLLSQANEMGCFDGQIKAYSENDLSPDFLKDVGDIIKESRGGGYWLWKSFIILDMLNKLNENDILLYADGGCTLQKSGLPRLLEYKNMIAPSTEKSILAMQHNGSDNDYREKIWTTDVIFNHFNIAEDSPHRETNQYVGGVIMCRKTPESIAFISKWLDIARKHPDLFTNMHNEITHAKRAEFRENRHDQSIFSLLVKTLPSDTLCITIPQEIEAPFTESMPITATRIK